MKYKYTIPVMVSVAVLLTACGGGSTTTSSSDVSSSTFKLQGTVPGTLIEAFCEDGSYHAVDSETNGTSQHPFSLDMPVGVSCRVVMTTNENDLNNKVITPIRFVNASGVGSTAIKANTDVTLDFIDLALSRDDMLSDANQDGVEDSPKEVILDAATSQVLAVIPTANDPLDDDNDGIINVYEDDDNDQINNHDDDDDDGDNLLDIYDNDHDNDNVSDNDLDGDGITNDKDVDDDNDGLHDSEDDDDDNDGISDSDDSDDDNDGTDDDMDSDYDSSDDNSTGNPTTPTPTNPTTTSAPSAGRLLAAQCAQCHGTDGISKTGIDSLAGESRGEIIEEMLEMQNESNNEVMHLQAKGYNAEQIGLIADYFSSLPRSGGND